MIEKRMKVEVEVDGEIINTSDLSERTGYPKNTCDYRIRKYRAGNLSKPDLLKKKTDDREKYKYDPKISAGTSPREREALRRIPGNGKYDALLSGHSVVDPRPFTPVQSGNGMGN